MVTSFPLVRILTFLQIFTSFALASIVISSPSSTSSWKINTTSKVNFTSSSTLPPFTVEILNADQKVLSGAYALASSDQLKLWGNMLTCPGLPAAFGYRLLFVNVSSPSQVFASSEQFEIEAESTNNTSPSTSPTSPTTSYLIYPSQVAFPSSFSLDAPQSSSSPSPSSSQVSSGFRRETLDLLSLGALATTALSLLLVASRT